MCAVTVARLHAVHLSAWFACVDPLLLLLPALAIIHNLQGLNKRDPNIFDLYLLDMPTLTLSLHTVNPGEINNWLMDYDFKIRVSAGVPRQLQQWKQQQHLPSSSCNSRRRPVATAAAVFPSTSSRSAGGGRCGNRTQGGGQEGQQQQQGQEADEEQHSMLQSVSCHRVCIFI